MIYRKFGKSKFDVYVITLGTWVMGGWMWGGAEEKESIDADVSLIDTAPAKPWFTTRPRSFSLSALNLDVSISSNVVSVY